MKRVSDSLCQQWSCNSTVIVNWIIVLLNEILLLDPKNVGIQFHAHAHKG